MSTPWELTVWVICQDGRSFDYRFSRAAAFNRAAELRRDVPSGSWSVRECRARLYEMVAETVVDALGPCPFCGMHLTSVTLNMKYASDVAWEHPSTGCVLDGKNIFGKQVPIWNRRALKSPPDIRDGKLREAEVERAAEAMRELMRARGYHPELPNMPMADLARAALSSSVRDAGEKKD